MKLFLSYLADVSKISQGSLPKNTATIDDVLTIVFGIIGALAFLMVVISGLRFVLSSGEPEKAAKARSALVYALVGLLVAVSAQAITYYVVTQVN